MRRIAMNRAVASRVFGRHCILSLVLAVWAVFAATLPAVAANGGTSVTQTLIGSGETSISWHSVEPGKEVHQWIASCAYAYFCSQVEGSEMQTGTYAGVFGVDGMYPDTRQNTILDGARDEDKDWKPPLNQGDGFDGDSLVTGWDTNSPYNRHFCASADALDTGLSLWGLPRYNSAYSQAFAIWNGDPATNRDDYLRAYYTATTKKTAYYYLGHVAHLIADMTIPAHTHNDPHGSIIAGVDSYEPWVAAQGRFLNYYYSHTDVRYTDHNIAVPSGLHAIFNETADYTDDYPSDDEDADSTPFPTSTYHKRVAKDQILANCPAIADDLMPWAIIKTAELYRYFYSQVDTSDPTCSMSSPASFSTNAANPTLYESLASITLTASGTDPESGIFKRGYEFYYASKPVGGSWSSDQTISNPTGGNSVSFTPQNNTVYRIGAKATNGGGRKSDITTTYRYFQVAYNPNYQLPAPTLTAPATGATGLSDPIPFSWSAVPGANSGYRLLIATTAAALPTDPTADSPSNMTVNQSVTAGTSYPLPAGSLQPGTTYFWEVHGRSSSYYGLWSEKRSFTTAQGATPTVALPVFSYPTGTYPSAISVTVTSSDATSIRYTLDGTEPTASSALYSGAISIGTNCTLKARGYRSGYNASATASAVYTFSSGGQQWWITGFVTFNGTPLDGVTMQGFPSTAVTMNTGFYGGFVPDGWTGTLTPSRSGYTFSPHSYATTPVHSNLFNQDFTATIAQNNITISGQITLNDTGLSGITIRSADRTYSTQTDNGGYYTLSLPQTFCSSVMPDNSGYTFTPGHYSYDYPLSDESDQDYTAVVRDTSQPGTLTVTLEPGEAVAAGAGWHMRGHNPSWYETAWRPSGDTYYDMDRDGERWIVYKDIPDWHTPAGEMVSIGRDQAVYRVGHYTRICGSVRVTVGPPEAAAAGGRWRIVGTAAWLESGAVAAEVPVGQTAVEFLPIDGWIQPDNSAISVADNLQSTMVANYRVISGANPTIDRLYPTMGPLCGGGRITITGYNFNEPLTVSFGDTPSTCVSRVSSRSLIAVVPPGQRIGTVPVTVTAAGGTGTASPGYTYVPKIGENMQLIGQFGGAVDAADVSGNYAYIGEGASLAVLDISNLATPTRVAALPLAEHILALSYWNNHAHLITQNGVWVVDVANPLEPSLVGYCPLATSYKCGISVVGGMAYIACYQQGLEIVDVTDPAEPRLVGGIASVGTTYGVKVAARAEGLFAYLATATGLKVVDVSNPAAPVLGGTAADAKTAVAVAIEGDYAYVLYPTAWGDTSALWFVIYDIHNAQNIVSVGTIAWSESEPGPVPDTAGYSAIEVRSGKAYVSGMFSTLVCDVSDRTRPTQISGYINAHRAQAFSFVSDKVLMPCEFEGFVIAPASPGFDLPPVGQYIPTIQSPVKLVKVGDWCYVAEQGTQGTDYSGVLKAVDMSDPTRPSLQGVCNGLSCTSLAVSPSAEYLYVTGQHTVSGLIVVDIRSRNNPTVVWETRISYSGTNGDYHAKDCAVRDGYLYVACYNGVQVYSLQNPASPVLVKSLDMPHLNSEPTAYTLALGSTRAYVASSGEPPYIHVLDISDPAQLCLVGSSLVPNRRLEEAKLVSRGTLLYLPSFDGVHVYDMSDPTSATTVSIANADIGGWNLALAGDTLFFNSISYFGSASGRSGSYLNAFNISTPAFPKRIAWHLLPSSLGDCDTLAVTGDMIYAACSLDGLAVYQLRDTKPPEIYITNPTFSPSFDTVETSIKIGGTATDNKEVMSLLWSSDRGGTGSVSLSAGSWLTDNIQLLPGLNNIAVTAFDSEGNSASDTIAIVSSPPDFTPPTVASILASDASPTTASEVSFRVLFSEDVVGVDASDFAFAVDGVTSPTVVSVSGSGTTYTVRVGTGLGDGSLRLDLKASDTGILDLVGNALVQGFSGGESYLIDRTPPEITILGGTNVSVIQNAVYQDAGAVAVDRMDGVVTAGLTATGLPLDTSALGTRTVTYSVRDATGNRAQATRSVIVRDPTAPLHVTFQTDGTPGATLTGATSQTINSGADCTAVTANAPAGWHFAMWKENWALYSYSKTLTVRNVTEDMTLTATFAPGPPPPPGTWTVF